MQGRDIDSFVVITRNPTSFALERELIVNLYERKAIPVQNEKAVDHLLFNYSSVWREFSLGITAGLRLMVAFQLTKTTNLERVRQIFIEKVMKKAIKLIANNKSQTKMHNGANIYFGSWDKIIIFPKDWPEIAKNIERLVQQGHKMLQMRNIHFYCFQHGIKSTVFRRVDHLIRSLIVPSAPIIGIDVHVAAVVTAKDGGAVFADSGRVKRFLQKDRNNDGCNVNSTFSAFLKKFGGCYTRFSHWPGFDDDDVAIKYLQIYHPEIHSHRRRTFVDPTMFYQSRGMTKFKNWRKNRKTRTNTLAFLRGLAGSLVSIYENGYQLRIERTETYQDHTTYVKHFPDQDAMSSKARQMLDDLCAFGCVVRHTLSKWIKHVIATNILEDQGV